MADAHQRRSGRWRGLAIRRGRLLAIEGAVALAVGGVAIGGAGGSLAAGIGVLTLAAAVARRRGEWLSDRLMRARSRPPQGPAREPQQSPSGLSVVDVTSRSSGLVGVIGDGQGYAAGLELAMSRATEIDVGRLAAAVAADPSKLSSVQLRVSHESPPIGPARLNTRPATLYRQAFGPVAMHRRVVIVLRFEPALATDVVDAHGGGAQGARAALIAAVDRLSAFLRGAGLGNRVLDSAALNALLRDDAWPGARVEQLVLDVASHRDLDRIAYAVAATGCERRTLSICVDVAGGRTWSTYGAISLVSADGVVLDGATSALLAQGGVRRPGPGNRDAQGAVLPLGGGAFDLTRVLLLEHA